MTNANFNVTTAKALRSTLAKYHTAGHNLKDVLANFRKQLKEAEASKTKLEESLKSDNLLVKPEEIYTAIKVNEATIASIKSDIDKARKKAEEREAEGLALVTDDLYKAYVSAWSWKSLGEVDYYNGLEYRRALVKWFSDNGVTSVTEDNVRVFEGMVSQKRSGARNTDYFRTAEARKSFNKDFIEGLCDYLQARGLIAPHKYEYIVKRERKNKGEA